MTDAPLPTTEPVDAPEANYFQQFVDKKEEAQPPSWYERAKDTAVANWYSGTLTGVALAEIQALKSASGGNNLTDAQLAQIKNKAYPESDTWSGWASDKSADLVGGIAGSLASPESFVLPGIKAAAAIKKGLPFAEKFMPGLVSRMVDSGANQAAVMAVTNPILQNARIRAGLQKEFDPWELAVAPMEGFAFGAGIHGAIEVGARGTSTALDKVMNTETGRAIGDAFQRRLFERAWSRAREGFSGFQGSDNAMPPPPPANEGAGTVTGEVSVAPPPAVQAATQSATSIAQGRETIPPMTQEASAAMPPNAQGGPAGIFMFNPTELKVDAKRFQFKEGGDAEGVTTRLKSVSKWDQAKGNQIIAWEDNKGQLFVVDGHQRTGLAKRLVESGKEQDIKLPGLLYREADGISADDVRAIAAVKNIAEGSGSALDGAKVLRSRPDLMDGSLPLSEGKSRQAFNLARLGDEPFRMVVNDVVPENYGAIVGENIPNDPARQEAAIKAIAKFKPSNEREAAALSQRVAQSELTKAAEGSQGSMFGDLESADSTAGQEMKIVGKAIDELKKDKTLFGRVVANASDIEGKTGSTIEKDAAKEVTDEAVIFAKRLASEAYTAGPVRDALLAAAKDLRDEKITLGQATERIRTALRGAAETDGGARTGNRASGEPAGQAAGGRPAGPAADSAAGGYINTRGGSERFHGTGAPIKKLSDQIALQAPHDANFYGDGFYTTDAVDMAVGYTKKGGKEPTLYKVEENPVKLFNMEAPLDNKTRAMVEEVFGEYYPFKDYGNETHYDNLREIFDAFRDGSEVNRLPRYEVQEYFHSIRTELEKEGYRGYEHLGGVRTKNEPHSVKIFWNPEQDVKIQKISADKYKTATERTPAGITEKDGIPIFDVGVIYKEAPWKNAGEGFSVKEHYERNGDKLTLVQQIREPQGGVLSRGLDESGIELWHEIEGFGNPFDGTNVGAPGQIENRIRSFINSRKIPKIQSTESTPAGEQSLIPGVKPVTDADRITLEQSRPMTGGNEPAGGMFDENNTNQPGLQFRRGAPNYPPGAAQQMAERRGGIIQSLQRQAFDLADILGVPLRSGRVKGGAQAQFESTYGVIRAKEVGDFLTVAHEAGHALEQKMGPSMSALIARHRTELAALDPSGSSMASEGFAEWVRHFIENPAYANTVAPGFAPEFVRLMEASNPRLLDNIRQASDNYNAYLAARTGERIDANVQPLEEQGWFADLKRTYKEQGIAPTIGRVMADAYTAIFDQYNPLNTAVRDLVGMIYERNGQNPVVLRAAQNPEVLARMWFARAGQGAAYQLRYGVVPYKDVTPSGPSLHDAISLAVGEPSLLGKWDEAAVKQFSDYLVAKRALVLIDRYKAGDLPNYPVPFSEADAIDYVAANPQFEAAAQMTHDYNARLLQKQFDAGLIDKELFDELSKTPFYVPMFRNVADKPMAKGGAGGQSVVGPGQTDTIKTLRGSAREIIDPLQSIMQQTFLVERTIRHNDVVRAMVDLATRAGSPAGYLVEPVSPKDVKAMSFDMKEEVKRLAKVKGISAADTSLLLSSINNIFGNDPLLGTMFRHETTRPRGEPIVFYKEAGEMKAVRFMGGKEGLAVYENIMSLPTPAQDIALQVMQEAGNIQRAGIVLNPTFMIANAIRDQVAVGILRPDYIPFWDGAKGTWAELTQKEAAQLYGYFGGESAATYVNESRALTNEGDIGALARKTWGQQRLAGPMAMAEAVQLSEVGTRNSIFAKVYEQKLTQGLSPFEAAMEAAWAGTDILDFSRHGSKTFAVRQFVPFLNAHLQGLDKARRTMLEPLSKAMRGDVLTPQDKADVANAYAAMAKFAIGGAALGAIWAAVNAEDEIYRDADPKRKATHFIFSAGGKEIDIPKPFELSLGFTLGEEAYARLQEQDPRAAGMFVTAAYDTLTPPNPFTDNPLVKAYFEGKTGVDIYTGRDIEPEALQKLPEELRYTERTSPLAIGISRASKVLSDYLNEATNKEFAGIFGLETPWSPIKVEHMFGTGFGTSGRDMMAAGHWFTSAEDSAPAQFEESIFLRRFIKDPTRTSDTVKRYYDHVAMKTGDYGKALSGYDMLVKTNRVTDAKNLYAKLSDNQKAYVVLGSSGDEEGKQVFSGTDRAIHPMTRAQSAVQQLSEIARKISGNLQDDSESGDHIALTRTQRKTAIEAIHQLGAQEMRNALVMTDEPGYSGRKLLDVNRQFEVIKAISPALADEVARRYATAKVFKTSAIQRVWPSAKRELVRAGSEADISDYAGDVKDEGFEFGGDRMPRTKKKRAPISGTEAIAP